MAQSGVAYKPGDVVSANYTFKKDKNEDLSFFRNDKLKIINIAKDPNWAHAKNSLGETGLIPLNYVQLSNTPSQNLKRHSWYHGRISRPESERILSGLPVGSFLIRDSDLFTGDLTLCVVGPPTPGGQPNKVDATDGRPGETSVGGICGGPLHPAGTGTTTTNVQHYHIIRKELRDDQLQTDCSNPVSGKPTTHYSLDEYDWFTNLPDLIQYYSVPDSGLVASLVHPVPDVQRTRLEQLRRSGWMLSRKDISLGDQIGRGEFGEVLKATYKGRQVAVKIYKKTACKLAITYEALLMTKLNHPNLVAFVGLVFEPDEEIIYLVTEYLPHGNLLTYLHSRTRDEVNERDKLQFSVDCCRGLTYLEERGIIHRDIAARNILLSGDSPRMVAKVADFGMARDVHNTNPLIVQSPQPTSAPPSYPGRTSPLNTRLNPPPPFTSDHSSHPSPSPSSDPDAPCTFEPLVLHDSAAIPVKWTAPEAVRKRVFSNKSDVWSFGILLWEIYSYGRIPYPRMMANQALRQIAAGYRMKAPEGCPPEIYDLMRRTWQLNPEDRPTFATILRELVHRLDDEHRIPDHTGPDKRCSPLSHLLMRTKDGGDPWLPKQPDCGLISDNPLESISDCYDLIDDVPAHSTSDSRQRLASSSRPDHSLMSRSFTSTTGGCTGVGKCGGQSISSKLISPGDGKSNTFCLPKFERFKL